MKEVPQRQLQVFAAEQGACQLAETAILALGLLFVHEDQRRGGKWSAPQLELDAVQRLVLDALDVIPRGNATITIGQQLASIMEGTVEPNQGCLDPTFRTALLTKWSSREVRNSVRAQNPTRARPNDLAVVQADMMDRQRADEALHGFRACALPSCERLEKSVREFKMCSACKAVAYCSPECAALHWSRAHKNECARFKAEGAKPQRADC